MLVRFLLTSRSPVFVTESLKILSLRGICKKKKKKYHQDECRFLTFFFFILLFVFVYIKKNQGLVPISVKPVAMVAVHGLVIDL